MLLRNHNSKVVKFCGRHNERVENGLLEKQSNSKFRRHGMFLLNYIFNIILR